MKWSSLVDQSTSVFWFRRDLRIEDNKALYHALKNSESVLPVFIFDTNILDELEDKKDARVTFIYETICALKQKFEDIGSSLLLVHGKPAEFFQQVNPAAVYANDDYEPYAVHRDYEIREILRQKNSSFYSFKDHVIFEKDEVVKENGQPYTVFTPYSKKWKSTLNSTHLKNYPSDDNLASLKQTSPLPDLPLEQLGFEKTKIPMPERIIKNRLISGYAETRDIPGIQGTSRLGVHFRFGTLSIRKAVQIAIKKNETWLNELIWREFYQMILWHFPHVVNRCFKHEYDHLQWRNDPRQFQLWCEGKTGYPLVDAGMRELNETGFMHNRVRMVTASFLTKHLLIDWKWGEAYFAKKLLDYELASNNGGWQWAAGCGCDAAPYFRVFNPTLQQQRFDPDFTYVRRWLPEYGSGNYPAPIIDHSRARERVLNVYKDALAKV
jgi:deoxyribodipyrimidine photo-lyase